jgi:hypothetical protein
MVVGELQLPKPKLSSKVSPLTRKST